LAALGVVVLIVALVALRDPHRSTTTANSATRTIVRTVPVSPSGSLRSSGSSSHSSSAPRSTPRTSSSASSSAPSTSSSSSSRSGLTGALPLVVVNTVGTPGLASSAAAAFRAGGWTVSSLVDDARSDILSTAAYYDPSVSNAQAVATALQRQFPAIKRVVAKFGGLPAGPIVVLLTADYSSG
jgi:LytR cell envelope-related transcriptional attenuator